MAATAVKLRLRRFGKWLLNQIVLASPGEETSPQHGPVELWTSLPSQTGERPERKIAGVHTRAEADRIAARMGLIVYHVLETEGEKMHARLDQEIRERKQRAMAVA